MKCLLCSAEDVTIKEVIPKKEIVRLWLDNDIDVYLEIKTPQVSKYCCKNCGLSFFDPENAGGDAFYSRLGEEDWYYLHEGKTEYATIQKIIKDNDSILDIGAGRGELYNRTKWNINYTGLELSSKAVELARAAGVNVINEDLLVHAEQHPGTYDVVCLFQVLEHLTELHSFIGAVKKCLKPGGLFCVAVPDNDGFLSKWTNNPFNLPPHHTLHWNTSSLKKLGELYGLEVVDIQIDELQNVHKDLFIQSYLTNMIRKMFGKKYRTVNFSIFFLISSALASKIRTCKPLKGLIRKLVFFKKRSGHSIFIVYKSKG